MAITVKDGGNQNQTVKTSYNGGTGEHTPHHNLDEAPIIGAVNEAPAASDTADSGLNGLFKRLLQRITSLLPAALTGAGNLKVAILEAAATSGGCSPFKLTSAATTNETLVKGSAGQVYGVVALNLGTGVSYLKLYNKATQPAPGSDAPVQTYPIPSGEGGLSLQFPAGLAFATGIGIAITGAAGDNDTTAIAAGEVLVNLQFK